MFLLCAWPKDEKNKIAYLMDGALAALLFEWGRKESLFLSVSVELQITEIATS